MTKVVSSFVIALICLLVSAADAAPNPVLSVSPTVINLEVVEGQNPPPQVFTIRNTGNGALKWVVTQLSEAWAMVSPLRGVNAGSVTVRFATASLPPGDYSANVEFQSNGGQLTAPVNVRIIQGDPNPQEICGDGIDNDNDGQIDEGCPPPPPTGNRGPQASLPCPTGAVSIFPGQETQIGSSSYPAGTVYCLQGTFTPTAPIRPKTGDTLHGDFGTIINGQNVTQSFDVGGTTVISGWNCGASCSDITIRNLYIRGRDTINCVGSTGEAGGGWIVENNDIRNCRWGVSHHTPWVNQLPQNYSRGWKVRNNVIANNVWPGATGSDGSGGYGFANMDDVLFENNELFGNGGQPKFTSTRRSIVRGNWFHHNQVGIWHDGDNTDALIENNITEDNCAEGIFYEISASGIIRNNTVRRNGFGCPGAAPFGSGVYISTSRDMELYGNTFEDNFRDINLFANCNAIKPAGFFYPTQIEFDLRNIHIHDNVIRVANQEFNVMAAAWSWGTSDCSASYVNPATKNIRFISNRYEVFSPSGSWWFWSPNFRTFSQWQALGLDVTGIVVQR